MSKKEKRTAAELEQMGLEIVRRMQGCDHVEAVSVSADPHKGWFISSCTPGFANNSDVQWALMIAEADLVDLYDLAWADDTK